MVSSSEPAGSRNGVGSRTIEIDNVSIVFGNNADKALTLADAGKDRAEIQTETGAVLGVHDCSLDVDEGEIVVLMGLSGSGKSTLLRAVNGLNPITRGEVTVYCGGEARNVATAGDRSLREIRSAYVSMVFQQFALLPWRTVAANVGLGLELSGVGDGERRERVLEQLDLVGLSDWADRQVGELSGGMQQRVGLARAFATGAPILLMDEPFSALDPLIRARLQDELLDLQARLRKTILFVSHDLDEAIKIGNRIAIMEGGRIVQCGAPGNILNEPANEYVADFVAHMNPLAVCTAADAMQTLERHRKGEATCPVVAEDAPLKHVIALQLETGRPVYVERAGRVIGRIGQTDVQKTLLR